MNCFFSSPASCFILASLVQAFFDMCFACVACSPVAAPGCSLGAALGGSAGGAFCAPAPPGEVGAWANASEHPSREATAKADANLLITTSSCPLTGDPRGGRKKAARGSDTL